MVLEDLGDWNPNFRDKLAQEVQESAEIFSPKRGDVNIFIDLKLPYKIFFGTCTFDVTRSSLTRSSLTLAHALDTALHMMYII